jgi:hypothetical protein
MIGLEFNFVENRNEMNNINQIRQRLTEFKEKIELEFKPIELRYIKLETSTNYKISLIESNKPLVQKLPSGTDDQNFYKLRPEAYQKDMEELFSIIETTTNKYDTINKRLIASGKFEELVKLKPVTQQFEDLNTLCKEIQNN